MLYIVATPIGNLGDISPRALEVLGSVDLIAAEDTRHTLGLLNHFGIRKPLSSLHEHNEAQKGMHLVDRIVREGISVALVTDAGTPAVSDPGALFVRLAVQAGVEVVAVPGPSAVIAALSVSGIANPTFSFFAFPPRAAGDLKAMLSGLPGHHQTVVFHESPHRVSKLLEAVLAVLGDIPCSLSCDLTKLHELTLRGLVSQVLGILAQNVNAKRGEYVLVLDLSALEQPEEPTAEILPEALLLDMLLHGLDMKDAVEALTSKGFKRNALKGASLRLKEMLRPEILQKNNTQPAG